MTSDSLFETTAGLPNGGRQSASEEIRTLPALTIMAHPDCNRIGERTLLTGLQRGVAISRGEPDFGTLDGCRQQPLLDAFISRQPFHLSAANKGGISLDMGDSRTRIWAGGDPVHASRQFSQEEIASGIDLVLAERVVLLLHLVTLPAPRREGAYGMVGGSSAMAGLYAEVANISDPDVSVLLRGETGTGKELMARALHENGPRRNGQLVSVNLGAIPANLAAAELFGAVRGAFTGAVPRTGFFRSAHRGTLFLDEIGEASAEVQTMLLRVLETGEIFPVGSQTPIKVDVRLLAATDVDLEEQVAKGHFRSALLQRLTGYEIRLPPLRERREDIGRLFFYFARMVLEEIGGELPETAHDKPPWIPAALMARLCRPDWPGNVRQLRNLVRQLVISCRAKPHLVMGPAMATALQRAGEPDGSGETPGWRKPETVTREELEEALAANAWNLKATAARLNISRTSLYKLVEETPGLHTAANLSSEEIEEAMQRHGGNLPETAAALKVSTRALRTRLNKLGMTQAD